VRTGKIHFIAMILHGYQQQIYIVKNNLSTTCGNQWTLVAETASTLSASAAKCPMSIDVFYQPTDVKYE
jgi:hypothetical protein